jgi:hypothetical protein
MYGVVTLIMVSEPKEEQFYVMCLETAISGPRLIRAWKRRSWIEEIIFRLKHYWRFVDCEALELKALSSGEGGKAA